MKKEQKYYIYVPRNLIHDEMDLELREGVLMAYCYAKRYATLDGIYSGRFRKILSDYGLHYDESKTKPLPNQACVMIQGFDYLVNLGIFRVIDGDYYSLDSDFSIRIESDNLDSKFVILAFDYFDYILRVKKRINKMGMLYALLFVLSCYRQIEKSGEKQTYCVCSYPLYFLSQITHIPLNTISKYLKNLCADKQISPDAPLTRSERWVVKIGDKYINLPNIYVENKVNAQELIKQEQEFIIAELKKQKPIFTNVDSFDFIADDDLY